MDIFVGMGGDQREQIAQVEEGIEGVAFGGLDKTIEGGGGTASPVTAHE